MSLFGGALAACLRCLRSIPPSFNHVGVTCNGVERSVARWSGGEFQIYVDLWLGYWSVKICSFHALVVLVCNLCCRVVGVEKTYNSKIAFRSVVVNIVSITLTGFRVGFPGTARAE